MIYRHYNLAGDSQVGVETIAANSGGTITSDTLSFYVRDEVGSVVATITENLGGANQTVFLSSYDAWGKARPTTGSTAYQDLAPGTFYSPTPSGQEEGYAGHDNLSDTGLVDMEGRVYDPEVGTFLSADPNVQYPFSSQGYDRYIYVNDNPLSLSDPSGYLSEAQIGGWISDIGPFLNAIPGCQYWCTAVAEAVGGYMQSGNNIGAGLKAGVLSAGEEFAFSYVGGQFGENPLGTDLLERSVIEGLIGGAFSEAGGGNFGDGFLGAFTSSELSPVISQVAPGNYTAVAIATRAVIAGVVGGTVSSLIGGNFTEAAMAAAMQRMFNDENHLTRAERFEHDIANVLGKQNVSVSYDPKTDQVKIVASIYFDGTYGTNTTVHVVGGIESFWSGKIGEYTVSTTVNIDSTYHFGDIVAHFDPSLTRESADAYDMYLDPNTTSVVAAHEFGHVLGLMDQYTPIFRGSSEVDLPNIGSYYDVMGNPLGLGGITPRVTAYDIEQVLDNYVH